METKPELKEKQTNDLKQAACFKTLFSSRPAESVWFDVSFLFVLSDILLHITVSDRFQSRAKFLLIKTLPVAVAALN